MLIGFILGSVFGGCIGFVLACFLRFALVREKGEKQ